MMDEDGSVLWEKQKPTLNVPNWRPKVILSCAISLDGKLASKTGDSNFSSFRDKREVHKLRTKVDAVLVGINTVIKDDPHLTVSQKYYKSDKHPFRIVLDSKARTPPDTKFIKKRQKIRSLIATTKQAPQKRIETLQKAGAEIRVLGKKYVSIPQLLEVLTSEYHVEKLMVEGGGKIIGSFLEHEYIDRVRISYTPVLLGGNEEAVNMVEGIGFSKVNEAPTFDVYRVEQIDWNTVLHLVRKQRGESA